MTAPGLERAPAGEVGRAEGPPAAPEGADGGRAGVVVTVIERSPRAVPLDLRALWEYRELLLFLVWRDVQVRYRQTALGALWAILQPLLSMLIFTVFFGMLARIPADGAPYALFAYVGLLPWTFFANAMSQAGNSLVSNQGLIAKVYFPRLVIPLSATLSGLLDLLVAFALVVPLLAYYGHAPGLRVLLLPLFVLLALGAAFAAGLWLSALNIQYRDVRYTLPFLTQIWMFATPVVYPTTLVPERYRALYALNPMVGVVEGFRWSLLGTGQPPGVVTLVSVAVVVVLLVGGLYYFRSMERTFADII